METCPEHPENETCYRCMKHELTMCEACLFCRDPKIYCKFRPSCPIWFITREKERERKRSADTSLDE